MTPNELQALVAPGKDAAEILRVINQQHKGLIEAFLATNGQGAEEEEIPIRLLQIGEFLRVIGDPPPMLIEQHLPEMSLFLMTAKPKFGKSFMALDIADCVATGKPLFGEFAINRPGPVVYLAMEDGDYEVANRCIARGIVKDDSREIYICTDNFKINSLEAIEKLKAIVAPIKPVLLIIDTATESLGIKKWEDRGEVSEKMRPLRLEFARKVCSVLLIAHNRKAEGDNGDEISGSNAFTGAVDGWWSIYNKRVLNNNNLQLFYRRQGRGSVKGEGAVEMDTKTLHFKALTEDEIAKAQKEERREREDVARYERYRDVGCTIQSLEGKASVGQVMRELEWEYGKAYAVIQEMLKAGFLEDTGEKIKPEGTKGGKPAPLYRVTELFNLTPISIDMEPKLNNSPPKNAVDDFFDPPPRHPYKDDDETDEDWRDA